jgi:three-Cys-motif partner protein
MNQFGGSWTYEKISIVEDYAKAYLKVMNAFPYWKLMYFDGFAGSGQIQIDGKLDENIIQGAAKRIISIEYPRIFDIYYFVELDKLKAESLKRSLDQIQRSGVYVVSEDCNKKLLDLAEFLKGKKYRVLAFLDPCGMAINWSSLEALKGFGIDLWILIPTGLGANRLLVNDGNIPELWLQKLESFFGIDRTLLLKTFYKEYVMVDLFGNETRQLVKNEKSVKHIQALYTKRLLEIYKYVSTPYELENKTHSLMFHFRLASNTRTAVKIANEIIEQKKQDKYGTVKY